MNQNVLSHIHNSSTNDNAMTKERLQSLRDQQKQKGDNNDHYSLQLLRIFGGIDTILDSYLASNDLALNTKQLNQIHQILSTQKHEKRNSTLLQPLASTKTLFSVPNIDIDNKMDTNNNGDGDGDNGEDDKFYYTFYTSDTFLHQITNAKRARKLINMSYSKRIYIFVMLVLVGWVVLIGILGIGNSPIIPIYGICMNFLFVPTEILVLLSANRKAFKLVIKSFEFWFKVVYSFFFGILISVYYTHSKNVRYKVLTTIEVISFLVIVFPLFITCISIFDAVHLSKLTKTVVMIVAACIASGFSAYFQFFTSGDDDLIIHFTETHSVSTLSTISSVLRVLSIFIWKQLYNQLRRQSEGKCVMIKYTPYMKWIKDDEISKTITMGIIDTEKDKETVRSTSIETTINNQNDNNNNNDDENL